MDNMPQPKRNKLETSVDWHSAGWNSASKFYRDRLWHVAVASGTLGAAIGGLLSWYLI